MSAGCANVSIVIPSYNERDNISEAIDRLVTTLGDRLLEIIVVDDDSPDRTWEVVERLGQPRCRLIRRTDRRGLASALAQGTREAKGDVIAWLDCDLGIPPEDVTRLVDALEGYDVAIGSRYVPGGMDTRPKWRAFLSYLFNVYARLVLGPRFWDWTSGFAAARREILSRVPLSEAGFGDYFIEWAYDCSRAGVRAVEVPYRYGLRKSGDSKTDSRPGVFLRLGLQYAWRVVYLRARGVRRTP